MTGLLIMIVCCTVFAAISQKRTKSISQHYRHSKDRLYFFLLTGYMIFFAGLRTYYNDTHAYILGFNASSVFPTILSRVDWALGSNPGFRIYTAIIRTITSNVNVYLLVSACITYGINMWFIRKYSKDFKMSVFLFFMLGYYCFAMAAMKQTLATALSLVALDRFIQNRKMNYFAWILLGSTFHPYCLMYLAAPILWCQIPWKKGTWFLLLVVASLVYSFNFLPGLLINLTESFGESYTTEMFVGEGINIFRVMVYFVPLIISFLWRRKLFNSSSKIENFFVNASCVCAMIMFIGLFGNANTFARLAMYFEPPIYIALPWMAYKLKDALSGFIISAGCYTAFPLFFLYQNVLSISFDDAFRSVSIFQFLYSLAS